MRNKVNNLKQKLINLLSAVVVGLMIAALIVADKTAGIVLFGLALFGVAVLLIVDKELRRRI